LRPLSLSDIYNGAAVYIRTNPRVTLGLTAVVVVITQIVTLAAAFGPLAAASRLRTAPPDELTGGDVGADFVVGRSAAFAAPASASPMAKMPIRAVMKSPDRSCAVCVRVRFCAP